jgi:ubiquinone biosynthesis protein
MLRGTKFFRTGSRLAQVTRVLASHGFGGLLRGEDHWPSPEQVRTAFEELGVVFLKLGQVLSTRRDLLPEAYIEELERLQDDVPAEDPGAMQGVIAAELGRPPDEVLASFDAEPLAAATIAQVHAARLADGREVVVKIQRPDLGDRIAEDLAVLAYLAAVLDTLAPTLRAFDPPAMVREFHSSLLRELDFRREARNVRRFRAALAGVKDVWIPDVIPEFSTAKVIMFERSHGTHFQAYLEQHPGQGPILARRLAAVFLRQVFEEGLFQADPHPGNFFVLADGTLCLHDFGMIGEIDPAMRDTLADLLAAVARGETRAVAQAYFDLGLVGPDVDRGTVEDAIGALLRDLRERPLAELSVGNALTALLSLGSSYRIRNPGVVLLLARAFLTLEAVMRMLDPQLDVLQTFRDALPGIAQRRFAPTRLAADAAEMARNVDRLLREAPAELRRGLRRFADG